MSTAEPKEEPKPKYMSGGFFGLDSTLCHAMLWMGIHSLSLMPRPGSSDHRRRRPCKPEAQARGIRAAFPLRSPHSLACAAGLDEEGATLASFS